MNKILVSYFSTSGVTREVANKIAKYTGGDLFEIEPINKYTDEDLNWNNASSRSSVSSVNNSFNTLKNTYSNLNFVDAKRLTSNVSVSDITSWII